MIMFFIKDIPAAPAAPAAPTSEIPRKDVHDLS